MYWGEFRAYLNSGLVFLFFLTYNLLSGNNAGFWDNSSRALLVASTILVSIALLLGPLSRMFPKKFTHDLLYRKPLAYSGTVFALLYFAISASISYQLDFLFMFSVANPDFLAWVFWFLGLALLAILAVAALPSYMAAMGFGNWKTLQVSGYAALFFMLVHLYLAKQGFYLATISGRTVLLLGATALLLKLIVICLGLAKNHPRKEIEILLTEH